MCRDVRIGSVDVEAARRLWYDLFDLGRLAGGIS
jgi:hypothetical protein